MLKRMDLDTLSLGSDSDFGEHFDKYDDDNLKMTQNVTECTNAQLMAVLQSVKTDTKETRDLISATRTDLDAHIVKTDERFSEVMEGLAKNDNDMDSLFARIKKCEVTASIASYESELQKQRALKNSISIAGIPMNDAENLDGIFAAILRAFDLRAADFPFSSIYRIKESRSHLIVVRFQSFEAKLSFMRSKRAKKIVLNDIVNGCTAPSADPEIYINNQLTPYFSNLLYHGRQAVSEERIHSSWVSNRGFVIRKTENDRPCEIKNVDHLNEFAPVKATKRRNVDMDSSPTDRSNPRSKPRVDGQVTGRRNRTRHQQQQRQQQRGDQHQQLQQQQQHKKHTAKPSGSKSK